jgi:hypothetical protein
MALPAPLASRRARVPPLPASPPNSGREPSSSFFFWKNPFGPPASEEPKSKREPSPLAPEENPNDKKELITLCRLSEDGSECEQTSIAWKPEDIGVVTQFAGYNGYKKGNCGRKGYMYPSDVQKHKIPFIGEITTRHYKKSDQLQYKSTLNTQDPQDPLTLSAALDAISTRTMDLISLVTFLGVVAFSVVRVRHYASVKGAEPLLV